MDDGQTDLNSLLLKLDGLSAANRQRIVDELIGEIARLTEDAAELSQDG